MRHKFVPVLLTAIAILTAMPVKAESTDENTPRLNFACELNKNVYHTVANSTANKARVPIFQWQPEVLVQTNATPKELCDRVTQKLVDFSAKHDLSSVNFIGTSVNGLPAICASSSGRDCDEVLFELRPTREDDSVVANRVINSILAQNLQPENSEFRTRGVQSFAYQVDFWSLLGLKFFLKH